MTRVNHGGAACCDPTFDLAGWLVDERDAVARLNAIAAESHERGRQLDAAQIVALQAGDDDTAHDLFLRRRGAHGHGNATAMRASWRATRADRIEAGHAHRLVVRNLADSLVEGGAR